MHIEQWSINTAIVLTLEGRFEFSVLDQFQSALKRIEDTHPLHIILDLSKVEFIDSAAIGRLVATSHRLSKSSIQFTLSGQRGYVGTVLKLNNIHELIPTANSIEEAEKLPPRS